MSTILLQLEAALADARAAQERAAERLHDMGVARALAKSQYDAAADSVKRVEGALNSMHGVSSASAVLEPTTREVGNGGNGVTAQQPKPKKRREEGQACPSCGAVGKLTLSMIGTVKFAICGECNAQHQAA